MQRQRISGVPTNILYTKQGLRNCDGSVPEGSSFSIQLQSSVVGKYINIAETELCFSLSIPLAVDATNGNAWLPNNSVLDLFSVESVQIDGLNLNLAKQQDSDMFINKILQNLDGTEEDKKMGLYKPEIIEELRQIVVDDTSGTTKGSFNTTASLGNQFTARSNQTGGVINNDPKRFIYSYENGRKQKQMARQYITTPGIDGAVGGQITLALNPDTSPLNQYCVRLGDLCPQLRNLAVVDAEKLLARGGLVISVKLLDSTYCMSGYLLESVSGVAEFRTKLELSNRAGYSISNIYLAVVQHQSDAMGRLAQLEPQPTPFITFFQFGETIQGSSFNRLFAVPQRCMVRGVIFQFYHISKLAPLTTVASRVGASVVIPSKETWSTEQAAFITGQRNYSQYVELDTVKVMLNGESYPKSQSAVIKPALYMQAHQFSREIFGTPYSVSFERFMTIDFAVFVPINQIVDSASNFQVQLQFINAQVNKQVHTTVVCDRTLQYQNGMVSIQ